MFGSCTKMSLRNIKRRKVFSCLNIMGLALGLACAFLILLWAQDELNTDRFHENYRNIYRINTIWHRDTGTIEQTQTPHLLAPALTDAFPEISDTVRMRKRKLLMQHNDKVFEDNETLFTEPSFFAIFTFPMVKGDSLTTLSESYSLVLTEKMASKYFGSGDPIGKTVLIENTHPFRVTGVIKNPPGNSSIKFDFLLPYQTLENFGENLAWGNFIINTYTLLRAGADIHDSEQRLTEFINTQPDITDTQVKLDALKRHHLYSVDGEGDIRYVYLFTLIALFILIIACINFMNLSTAQAAGRAKEIGLRKVVGADRVQLISQFLGESFILSFIAFILALSIAVSFLPFFNKLSGKSLILFGGGNLNILLWFCVITFITGILSGSYPALYLSSFKPVRIFRGAFKSSVSGLKFRQMLVVFQFSISILMIICTMIISKQIHYMQNKKLGLEKQNLVYFRVRNEDIRSKYNSLKAELLKNPNITAVTIASSLPTWINDVTGGMDWEGRDPEERDLFVYAVTDRDFIKTLSLEILEGRSFSKNYRDDISNYILNEEAAKLTGLRSPVGKRFSMWGREGKIIGILKNFHFKPVSYKIQPLVLTVYPYHLDFILIRIQTDNIRDTLHYITKVWKIFNPDSHLEVRFLDEKYNSLYESEQKIRLIFQCFAVFAIFISCLGLFGLSAYSAERATQEIGIRKVLGASIMNITTRLSMEYMKAVLWANLIAWPLAYFAMSRWLQNFAYRIPIQLETFFSAGILAGLIALLTVLYQTIRAAVSNPVDCLRHE